ncbi:MAG: hypothetical protein IIV40_01740 [Oscillospiraceae bacterium]|nr:hypothetical protein [Oscillospiraceae bacterium]
MDRRRMMMASGGLSVTLDFSEDTAAETCVLHNGKEFRKGKFRCKAGETITCVCTATFSRVPVRIIVDGVQKKMSAGETRLEVVVLNNLYITADDTDMRITTEK